MKTATTRLFAALALAPAALLPTAALAAEPSKLLSLSTLIGEIITFAILVWVVLKFVWPPLYKAIETRQKEIADGLAAAEDGKQSLARAAEEREVMLAEARAKSGDIVSDGEARGKLIVEQARQEAETEKARIVEAGRREVETEREALRRDMQQKLSGLIIAGATQVLGREVDAAAHDDIVEEMKKAF